MNDKVRQLYMFLCKHYGWKATIEGLNALNAQIKAGLRDMNGNWRAAS